MSRKILSLVLSFMLFFSQAGIAAVAPELNIAAYLGKFNYSPPDKLRLPLLRYFSYDNLNNNFKLILDKGDFKEIKGPELKDSSRKLLSYFLIGITLPNDSFWVNLRPDSSDNIIDDYLAQTDAGKILLEADLQLKKDTAAFTSPQTPEGKLYWDKLYQKAAELFGNENITIPTLTRPWIVPGEVIIRETAGEASALSERKRVEVSPSAYVYKASLKVMLEQDHLKDSATYNFKDPRLKALNEYSSQLIREFILPKLTKEVNISKRYAELRQVYYSLILARWFKARFYGKGGIYASAIDKKNLNGLLSQGNWSKNTYFKEYQKSFQQGEYNLKAQVAGASGANIRSYFSGGFDATKLTITTSTSSPIVGFTGRGELKLAGAQFFPLGGRVVGLDSLVPQMEGADRAAVVSSPAKRKDATTVSNYLFRTSDTGVSTRVRLPVLIYTVSKRTGLSLAGIHQALQYLNQNKKAFFLQERLQNKRLVIAIPRIGQFKHREILTTETLDGGSQWITDIGTASSPASDDGRRTMDEGRTAASPAIIDAKQMKEGETRDIIRNSSIYASFYYNNQYHTERTLSIAGKKGGKEFFVVFSFERPPFESKSDTFIYRPRTANNHFVGVTIADWGVFIESLAAQINEKKRTIEIRVRREDIAGFEQIERENPGLSLVKIGLEGDERFEAIEFVTEFSAASSPATSADIETGASLSTIPMLHTLDGLEQVLEDLISGWVGEGQLIKALKRGPNLESGFLAQFILPQSVLASISVPSRQVSEGPIKERILQRLKIDADTIGEIPGRGSATKTIIDSAFGKKYEIYIYNYSDPEYRNPVPEGFYAVRISQRNASSPASSPASDDGRRTMDEGRTAASPAGNLKEDAEIAALLIQGFLTDENQALPDSAELLELITDILTTGKDNTIGQLAIDSNTLMLTLRTYWDRNKQRTGGELFFRLVDGKNEQLCGSKFNVDLPDVVQAAGVAKTPALSLVTPTARPPAAAGDNMVLAEFTTVKPGTIRVPLSPDMLSGAIMLRVDEGETPRYYPKGAIMFIRFNPFDVSGFHGGIFGKGNNRFEYYSNETMRRSPQFILSFDPDSQTLIFEIPTLESREARAFKVQKKPDERKIASSPASSAVSGQRSASSETAASPAVANEGRGEMEEGRTAASPERDPSATSSPVYFAERKALEWLGSQNLSSLTPNFLQDVLYSDTPRSLWLAKEKLGKVGVGSNRDAAGQSAEQDVIVNQVFAILMGNREHLITWLGWILVPRGEERASEIVALALRQPDDFTKIQQAIAEAGVRTSSLVEYTAQRVQAAVKMMVAASASSPAIASPLLEFKKVGEQGEQIWIDGLTMEMLSEGGYFEDLVSNHGVTGVTTNPPLIKAYLKDSRVLAKAAALAQRGLSSEEVYYELIKDLATTVINIFKKYNVNGKFSVELDPTKADDAEASVQEAMKWTNIDPKYIMVKVAANEAGYKIIKEVTARGRNVNATLIFSPEQYRKVAKAYIRGLQRALKAGLEINRVYSVASFFISRWDVKFAQQIPPQYHGMFANAVAIVAYNEIFKTLFDSGEFQALKARGARIQDFLLASTGSKAGSMPENFRDKYPQDVYVTSVQGSNVVNTLPDTTIEHLKTIVIKPRETIVDNYALAREILQAMHEQGVDIEQAGQDLFKAGMGGGGKGGFIDDFNSIQQTLIDIVNKAATSSPATTPESSSNILLTTEEAGRIHGRAEVPQGVKNGTQEIIIIRTDEVPAVILATFTIVSDQPNVWYMPVAPYQRTFNSAAGRYLFSYVGLPGTLLCYEPDTSVLTIEVPTIQILNKGRLEAHVVPKGEASTIGRFPVAAASPAQLEMKNIQFYPQVAQLCDIKPGHEEEMRRFVDQARILVESDLNRSSLVFSRSQRIGDIEGRPVYYRVYGPENVENIISGILEVPTFKGSEVFGQICIFAFKILDKSSAASPAQPGAAPATERGGSAKNFGGSSPAVKDQSSEDKPLSSYTDIQLIGNFRETITGKQHELDTARQQQIFGEMATRAAGRGETAMALTVTSAGTDYTETQLVAQLGRTLQKDTGMRIDESESIKAQQEAILNVLEQLAKKRQATVPATERGGSAEDSGGSSPAAVKIITFNKLDHGLSNIQSLNREPRQIEDLVVTALAGISGIDHQTYIFNYATKPWTHGIIGEADIPSEGTLRDRRILSLRGNLIEVPGGFQLNNGTVYYELSEPDNVFTLTREVVVATFSAAIATGPEGSAAASPVSDSLFEGNIMKMVDATDKIRGEAQVPQSVKDGRGTMRIVIAGRSSVSFLFRFGIVEKRASFTKMTAELEPMESISAELETTGRNRWVNESHTIMYEPSTDTLVVETADTYWKNHHYEAFVDSASSPLENQGRVGGISASQNALSINSQTGRFGGIDFRSIPLIVQPIGNFSNLKFDNLPNTLTLQKMDLNEEFKQINSMVEKGILPSSQRVKEFILACCYKKELSSRIGDLIPLLTSLCRLQEECVCEAEPELKESLMLVEAVSASAAAEASETYEE